MKTVSIDYGPGMDREMVRLCDVLNSLPGIHTVESCAGHGERPMRVLFACKSLKSLAKIQHAVDIRYGGMKNPWRIECCTTDTPEHGTSLLFDLSSEKPYKTARNFLPVEEELFDLSSEKPYKTKSWRRYDYEPAFYHDASMFECSIELYSTGWGDAFVRRRANGPCPELVWKKFSAERDAVKRMYDRRMKMWRGPGCPATGKEDPHERQGMA